MANSSQRRSFAPPAQRQPDAAKHCRATSHNSWYMNWEQVKGARERKRCKSLSDAYGVFGSHNNTGKPLLCGCIERSFGIYDVSLGPQLAVVLLAKRFDFRAF